MRNSQTNLQTIRYIEYRSSEAIRLCGSGPFGKLFSLFRSVLNGRLFDCDDERRNSPRALRVDFKGLIAIRRMPHVENDRIVESTNEARAAVTGHNVQYVLLISTLAVIVLFILIAVAYLATSS